MKKKISRLFFAVKFLLIGMSSVSAQNFYSKLEAKRNLGDAAKSISAQLPELRENDEVMYKVQKERLRFVQNVLLALKSMTVEEAANMHLPKVASNEMQPAVKFIDTSFSGKTPNEYIRQEILYLISY